MTNLPQINIDILEKLSDDDKRIVNSINAYLILIITSSQVCRDLFDWESWDDFFIHGYEFWSYRELELRVITDYKSGVSSNGYLSGTNTVVDLQQEFHKNIAIGLSTLGFINEPSLAELSVVYPNLEFTVLSNITAYESGKDIPSSYFNELSEMDILDDVLSLLEESKERQYLSTEQQQRWIDIRLPAVAERLNSLLLYEYTLEAKNDAALSVSVMGKIAEEHSAMAVFKPKSEGGKAKAKLIRKSTKDKAKPIWEDWSRGENKILGKKFSDHGAQTAFATYCMDKSISNSFQVACNWDREWRKVKS